MKGKNGKDRADVWIDLLWRDGSTREPVSPNGHQGFVIVVVVLGCASPVPPCLAIVNGGSRTMNSRSYAGICPQRFGHQACVGTPRP